QLQKKVAVLNREISSLRAYIKGLQMNIGVLYVQTKKVLKEQFKAFRGIVKNELDSKGIDNHFEREHKREMNRHSGLDIDR
ncbi:mobilization protein, partial [Bacillus pseudomycoides]